MKSLNRGLKRDYVDPHKAIAVWEMDWVRFGFDCQLDVIEQEALNRKDCIEVLRNRIPSSKRKIEKLEADLFVFETQIEWDKSNKGDVIELCSKALSEKIDWLKLAKCILKNNDDHNNENRIVLQQHKDAELPKEIHESITTVLKNALYLKEQQSDNLIKVGLDAPETSVRLSIKNVLEDAPDTRETSIILSNKNVTENGVNALEISVRHSKNNVIGLEAQETSVRNSNNSAMVEVDAPQTSGQHSNHSQDLDIIGSKEENLAESQHVDVQEFALSVCAKDASQTSGRHSYHSQDSGSKEKSLAVLQHVDIQESRASACAEVRTATPKSSLMFEAKRVKAEPEEFTSSAEENGNLVSSLMLQKRAKEIVNARANSANCNVVPSELPLVVHRKRKDTIKLENIFFDHPNVGAQTSALMLQGQKDISVARAMQVMPQKSRTSNAGKVISSKTSLKVKGTNGMNRGRELLIANTGMSQDSKKVAEMEKAILKLELVSVQLDEIHCGEKMIRSNKGNAKRPNQMDTPNSGANACNRQVSASPITYKRTYKRTKKSDLSNSGGEKEPSKLPANGISRESCISPVPFDAMKSKGSLIANTDNQLALLGPEELRKWTVPQLKSVLKARGESGYSKFKKDDLIQLLIQGVNEVGFGRLY